MNDFFYILLGIVGLFIFLLIIKIVSRRQFCVLCGSVAGSWLILLLFYKFDLFKNGLLLALLMGQSITGIYYLAEKKAPEKYHLFRLPFLLTLTAIFYFVIQPVAVTMASLSLLIGLWGLFIGLFMCQTKPNWQSIVKKLIECCKNW